MQKITLMRKLFPVLLLSLLFSACDSSKHPNPATALDAGRDFIRASLDGNFETAESLLLKDTQNLQLFASYKMFFEKLGAEKKRNYKAASYTINKFVEVDDSTTVINYSNSYMNKPMEIKVVRADKKWQVDFKHTYSGNEPLN